MSSLSYSTFLSDMDQEEVIPFDPPIISKFGPISRTKYTKNNDTVPLKVTADEVRLKMKNSCHAEYFLGATLFTSLYPVNLQYSNFKQIFSIRMENSGS